MSFVIYLIGFAILIAGIVWGMLEAGIPHTYIWITGLILLGIGIMNGVSKTRSKDSSR